MDKLEQQASVAEKKDKEKRDHYDEKVLELARHVQVYRDLQVRKIPGLMPADEPDGKWMSYAEAVSKLIPQFYPEVEKNVRQELAEQVHKDPGLLRDLIGRYLGGARDLEDAEREFGGKEKVLRWILDQEIRARSIRQVREKISEALPGQFPGAAGMEKILTAYRNDDPTAFNAAVADYKERYTAGVSPSDQAKARLEARMNFFDPFLQCAALYVGVMVLAALSWLTWRDPLRRAAFGLACLTLIVHTAALGARMYIGNRPPVTNLYSSAVFIGWGGLALCLTLEAIYKLGVGTLAGAVLGFSTMLIARFVAESGDTLEMLQAVLDTNFWLATHVTCVTMGYVATFVAGLIGIVYIIGGVFTYGLKGEQGKQVAGMLYGTICFAM